MRSRREGEPKRLDEDSAPLGFLEGDLLALGQRLAQHTAERDGATMAHAGGQQRVVAGEEVAAGIARRVQALNGVVVRVAHLPNWIVMVMAVTFVA